MAQDHTIARTRPLGVGAAARGFLAGFAATLVFHQGMLALLHAAGIAPDAPFALQPTPPFGLPQVLSLAFWGGVWGIAFNWFLGHLGGKRYWIDALLFGALGPTLVFWFVVAPLKGLPMGVGWHAAGVATGLLVNAAWGLGTALLLRLARGRQP